MDERSENAAREFLENAETALINHKVRESLEWLEKYCEATQKGYLTNAIAWLQSKHSNLKKWERHLTSEECEKHESQLEHEILSLIMLAGMDPKLAERGLFEWNKGKEEFDYSGIPLGERSWVTRQIRIAIAACAVAAGLFMAMPFWFDLIFPPPTMAEVVAPVRCEMAENLIFFDQKAPFPTALAFSNPKKCRYENDDCGCSHAFQIDSVVCRQGFRATWKATAPGCFCLVAFVPVGQKMPDSLDFCWSQRFEKDSAWHRDCRRVSTERPEIVVKKPRTAPKKRPELPIRIVFAQPVSPQKGWTIRCDSPFWLLSARAVSPTVFEIPFDPAFSKIIRKRGCGNWCLSFFRKEGSQFWESRDSFKFCEWPDSLRFRAAPQLAAAPGSYEKIKLNVLFQTDEKAEPISLHIDGEPQPFEPQAAGVLTFDSFERDRTYFAELLAEGWKWSYFFRPKDAGNRKSLAVAPVKKEKMPQKPPVCLILQVPKAKATVDSVRIDGRLTGFSPAPNAAVGGEKHAVPIRVDQHFRDGDWLQKVEVSTSAGRFCRENVRVRANGGDCQPILLAECGPKKDETPPPLPRPTGLPTAVSIQLDEAQFKKYKDDFSIKFYAPGPGGRRVERTAKLHFDDEKSRSAAVKIDRVGPVCLLFEGSASTKNAFSLGCCMDSTSRVLRLRLTNKSAVEVY